MTGKERIKAAFDRQELDQVPWVPFVGCHGAALIDKTASEYLQDAELIVQGQLEAVRRYQPDGIPVTFDLQVEAEALGCQLKWENENPPAVANHILDQIELSDLCVPDIRHGRIAVFMEAAVKLRQALPDTALYGLITGPFTLAMHLAGSKLFIDMYDDPEGVDQLLTFCTQTAIAMSQGYIDAGCDVIAVVDPMTTQIGPDQFNQVVSKHCKAVFDYVRQQKRLSSFFVCGHALKNLEVMCDCGPDNVSVDENIPLDAIKEICSNRGISFGGNMRLTTVLLNGTQDSSSVHAYECIEKGGSSGYVLAPGCDLPYAVPPQNLEAVSGVVHDPYKRNIAAELAAKPQEEDLERLDLSDYGNQNKVIVDIITLDSEACAPCQYMVEAVKEVVPEFDDLVIWREHKIKSQEGVSFMSSLMVKNVPTIVIDGQIAFVSTIPTRRELIKTLQQRINEKLKVRISIRHSKITVIGTDERAEASIQNIRTAAKELGMDIDIVQSDDIARARSYGARKLPAVILSSSTIKSAGKVPEVPVIKEWMKDLV